MRELMPSRPPGGQMKLTDPAGPPRGSPGVNLFSAPGVTFPW
jgi:hypothetical protein